MRKELKMKIKDIISLLEKQGEWVNRRKTRDHLLFGNMERDIDRMIVCWVATNDIIQQAILEDCHFIICHENPFYLNSTQMHTSIIEATKEKQHILKKHDISIYRCHDLWDLYPEYGVLDSWAKTLDLPLEKSKQSGFYRYFENINMTTKDLALHIKDCIQEHGEVGIEVIGDLNKTIHTLAIGTGAITDVFEMCDLNADACLVSDDGINNWIATQWCMDHHIPLIVVNHRTAENAGMMGMKEYLKKIYPDIDIKVMLNQYKIYHLS